MSRIGKKAVQIPAGVNGNLKDLVLTIKGTEGYINMTVVSEVDAKLENYTVKIIPHGDSKRARSM